jgi:hypothetical protein
MECDSLLRDEITAAKNLKNLTIWAEEFPKS